MASLSAALILRARPGVAWGSSAGLSTSAGRASSRPSIQHPHHPSFDRLKLLTVSEPRHSVPHPTTETLYRDCPRETELAANAELESANPYEKIFARELRELLEQSPMVGLYHANNLTYYPARTAYQNARRCQLELKSYNYQIGEAVLRGTKWENLLYFWETGVSDQYLTFGQEINVKQMLQFEKKAPALFIIGALLDDRIVDRGEIMELAALSNLDDLRGQLCSILQMPARKTSSLIGRHPQALSQNLEQYMKDQSGDTTVSK
eukprot:maker-scaffold170_size291898-snap-gene-1.44 protein:Tk03011 transcript:maker-scaffold170_size291898-snap-gene-1.44-mRNA-1 annotation:"39s ribosomal protein mitochondrial"